MIGGKKKEQRVGREVCGFFWGGVKGGGICVLVLASRCNYTPSLPFKLKFKAGASLKLLKWKNCFSHLIKSLGVMRQHRCTGTGCSRGFSSPRPLPSLSFLFSFVNSSHFFLITQIQILLPRGFSQSVRHRRFSPPPAPKKEILTRRKWKKPQEDLREEEIDKAWQIYRWPLHLPLSLHPLVFIPLLAPSDRFILLLGVRSILHLLLRRRRRLLLLSGLCDLQTTDLQCIRWQALCKAKCWSVTGIHAHAASCLRSLLDLLWPPRWLQQRPVRFQDRSGCSVEIWHRIPAFSIDLLHFFSPHTESIISTLPHQSPWKAQCVTFKGIFWQEMQEKICMFFDR